MDAKKAQIEELRRKVAEKNQRIAELRREVAERSLAEWRRQVLAWAESPDRDLAKMPRTPEDANLVFEVTDEQRAAREAWIDQILEDSKNWGGLK